VRRHVVSLTLGWFLIGACCTSAHGDGGTLRLLHRTEFYVIAVFTAPTPFRAGPVDISVLIQDAATGEPVPAAEVTLRVAPRGRTGDAMQIPATTQAATNKLLHAAVFELPSPGSWDVTLNVQGARGPAQVRFELEAAQPLPRWLAMWPWLSWPALAIVFYGIHHYLKWRKSRHRALAVPIPKLQAAPGPAD
jgi:hypothetical protein